MQCTWYVPMINNPSDRPTTPKHEVLLYIMEFLQECIRCVIGILGTGLDIVPILPKCPVPVLEVYRTYRGVRYRYWRCTELTQVCGTDTKVCAGAGGTGIDVELNLRKFLVSVFDAVQSLPTFPIPVLMSYRTYRSVRYRYESLYQYRYRYRHTLEYIYRQYRWYIPPPICRRTLALRYINWT